MEARARGETLGRSSCHILRCLEAPRRIFTLRLMP